MHRKKSLFFYYLMTAVSVLFLLSVLVLTYSPWFKPSPWERDLAYNELWESWEKLKDLSDKHPDDVEIQLGLAYIKTHFGLLSYFSEDSYDWPYHSQTPDKYKKVLDIDPNNPAALAFFTAGFCNYYLSAYSQVEREFEYLTKPIFGEKSVFVYGDMEKSVRWYLMKKELGELKDKDIIKFLDCFGFDDSIPEPRLIVVDVNCAVEGYKTLYSEEINAVYAAIDNGQKRDPDNALYDYLRAYVYLESGKEDEAVKEIEKGLKKKYFTAYKDTVTAAVSRVLDEIKFRKKNRGFFEVEADPCETFITRLFWFSILQNKQGGLDKLAQRYEEKGDLKTAAKIRQLAVDIFKQSGIAYKEYYMTPKNMIRRLEEINKKLAQEESK